MSNEILDRKLLQDIPVCDDGKEKIKNLVEAMGFKFDESKDLKGVEGHVYMVLKSHQLYCIINGTHYLFRFGKGRLDRCGSSKISFEDMIKYYKDDVEFLASSLSEYYEKKANGEL